MKNIFMFLLFCLSNAYCQKTDCFDIARNGSAEQMRDLYEKDKAIINSKNEFGFTPLILSCYKGNNKVVSFLLEKNVAIDYVSDEGTALMAAVVKGNIELVELLIKHNANLDLTNSNGTTALMYAVKFNNYEITKLLIEHKSNKTILDKEGKTAFEYAVFSNNEKIINLLK